MLTQERNSVPSAYYEAFEKPSPISPAFIAAWKGKSQAQFKEELASLSLETNRIPDPYHFIVDADGDLFSPNAKCKIRDSIRTVNHVGRLEAEAFNRIEKFTRDNDHGVIAWISPPDPEFYPGLKIIISEIQKKGSAKLLFNRAILLDFNDEVSLKFAQSLAEFSLNKPQFTNNDQVRAMPLVLDTSDAHWTDILQNLVGMPEVWESVRSEADLQAKQQALIQAEAVYGQLFDVKQKFTEKGIVPNREAINMMQAMIGNNSTSCPELFNSSFKAMFKNSKVLNSPDTSLPDWRKNSNDPDFCIRCGACQEEIRQVVRKGEYCPAKPQSCGAKREC